MAESKFCPQCGIALLPSNHFCDQCGREIKTINNAVASRIGIVANSRAIQPTLPKSKAEVHVSKIGEADFQFVGRLSGIAVLWVIDYLGVKEQKSDLVYRMASPVNQIKGSIGDVLIIHGTSDPLMPIAQSENLSQKILESGGCSEIIKLSGVGHGFGGGVSTAAQQTSNSAIDKFLRRPFYLN